MTGFLLNVFISVFLNLFVLYVFLFHFVKVVDLQKIALTMEKPILEKVGSEDPESLAKKKVLLFKAISLALEEQRGIVFLSSGVLKSPFEDVTDEVLERSRYWYAYLLSSSEFFAPEGGNKQGRKP